MIIKKRQLPNHNTPHLGTFSRYPTALKSAPYNQSGWSSEEVLKSVYIPEIEAQLKEVIVGRQSSPTNFHMLQV